MKSFALILGEACIAGEYEYINLHPSSQEDGLIGTIPLSNPQQMAITINRTQSLSDDENSDSILGGEDNNEKIDRQADLYSNPNVTSSLIQKTTITKKKRKRNDITNHQKDNEQLNEDMNSIIMNENSSKGKRISSLN
ncbi:unnamed protein product [Rotaria sp. Silwood1]|nr:unnamed protein product [Rotaria sp. Silwood1]